MRNILMLGFLSEEFIKVDGYATIIHSPFKPSEDGLSAREYHLACDEILKVSKLIIINYNKKNLSIDECYLIFSAYTNKVAMLGVGYREEHSFLDAMVLNKFKFMEDALSHIRKNY